MNPNCRHCGEPHRHASYTIWNAEVQWFCGKPCRALWLTAQLRKAAATTEEGYAQDASAIDAAS